MARKVKASGLISQEDLERLEDLSRETGKSISSLVREAVKQFLNKQRKVGGNGDE